MRSPISLTPVSLMVSAILLTSLCTVPAQAVPRPLAPSPLGITYKYIGDQLDEAIRLAGEHCRRFTRKARFKLDETFADGKGHRVFFACEPAEGKVSAFGHSEPVKDDPAAKDTPTKAQ